MSDFITDNQKRVLWIIRPDKLPEVWRRCPKCGHKTSFENSGKFRVNGNGRLLDVWLIYSCRTCKSTWNMTVYERVSPESIDREEYQGFLCNDRGLAEKYGTSRELFAKNGAETVESQLGYQIEILETTAVCSDKHFLEVEIKIAGPVRLRADALFADQLKITRSRAKSLLDQGKIQNGGPAAGAGKRIRDGQVFYIPVELVNRM